MVYRFGCLIVALRAVLVLLIITGSSLAHAIDSERWPTLKQNYFGDRSIATNSQIISLEAPKRAHDAATVPVFIKAMDKGRQIKEVYLFAYSRCRGIGQWGATYGRTFRQSLWRMFSSRIGRHGRSYCQSWKNEAVSQRD